MGDRAYVVTFQETDPMFVFDLSDARAPKLLGELKMPGYSTYLHPYDATHLIGIGKNAITNTSSPGFAWYQGLKLGLFDVTDPAHPVEMFKTEIGDRGTDSAALTDHHAFLFSKEKNLLAIPITVAQLTSEQKKSTSTDIWEYGQVNYQGLFVYNIDLINGFSFQGGITHFPESNSQNYVNYYGQQMINRSLYIGDNLYALSEAEMTVHRLSDLTMLSQVKLSNLSDNPVYYLEAPAVK
jgi:inhibitor of cysteine peptidase